MKIYKKLAFSLILIVNILFSNTIYAEEGVPTEIDQEIALTKSEKLASSDLIDALKNDDINTINKIYAENTPTQLIKLMGNSSSEHFTTPFRFSIEESNLILLNKFMEKATVTDEDIYKLLTIKDSTEDSIFSSLIEQNKFNFVHAVMQNNRVSNNIKYLLLKNKNDDAKNALMIAMEKENIELLRMMIMHSGVTEEQLLSLLSSTSGQGLNALMVAKNNKESINFILNSSDISENNLLKLIGAKSNKLKGNNFILHCVNNNYLDSIEVLLNTQKIKNEDKVKLLASKNYFNENIFTLSAKKNNGALFNIIKSLNFIEREDVKSLLLEKELGLNRNSLMISASIEGDDVSFIKSIIEYLDLSKKEFLDLIQEIDKSGKNILHISALNGNSNILSFLLNYFELSASKKFKLLKATDDTMSNPFMLATSNDHVKVLKVIFDELEEKNKYLEVILAQKNINSNNAYEIALQNKKGVDSLQFLDAIADRNGNGSLLSLLLGSALFIFILVLIFYIVRIKYLKKNDNHS